MPVSLSIKNVPDEVVERLRARAARNRRSLQGELLDLVERAADETPTISAREVYARIRKLNLPCGGEFGGHHPRDCAMADKVIDASALAAVAFAEPGADAVIDEIDGHRLHAPTLIVFELMSVAWKRSKKHPAATPLFLEALEAVNGLDLRFRGIDQEEVVRLGLATGLTAYDATYLWLSRVLGMPLVTLDKKLGAHATHV